MKILNKSRLWIIITVAILVVGLTFLTLFGFNNGVDFKKSYEVKISASEGINNVTDTIEESATKYFNENGISYSSYAVQVTSNGDVVYKFNYDVSNINVEELKNAVSTKVGATEGLEGIEITVNGPYETAVYYPVSVGYLILAVAVAMVAIFIYLYFMEKLAGALSVLATSILSAITYSALLALTRIPASPFYLATLIGALIFSGVISVVIVNRCNELRKNVGNDKLADIQIAEKATVQSLFRVAFMVGALVISAIALLIFGSGYLKFLGLQILALALTSSFISLAWTGLIWSLLAKGRKTATIKSETESK